MFKTQTEVWGSSVFIIEGNLSRVVSPSTFTDSPSKVGRTLPLQPTAPRITVPPCTRLNISLVYFHHRNPRVMVLATRLYKSHFETITQYSRKILNYGTELQNECSVGVAVAGVRGLGRRAPAGPAS